MSRRKDSSLTGGVMLLFVGFFGIILFIFNANTELLTFFQIFSEKITLEFLQWMSVFILIGGIVLLVDGIKSSS
jgi:hypothetical protein